MSTVVNIEPRIKNIKISDESIATYLEDGRIISVPLTWSWRLSEATKEQRKNYKITANGIGIHWPEIDEDLSAEGMLYGIPAKRPRNLEKKSA